MALLDGAHLAKFVVRVSDSTDERWTLTAAIDELVPAPMLNAAPYKRLNPRGENDFVDSALSALRYQFGGHEEKAAAKKGDA